MDGWLAYCTAPYTGLSSKLCENEMECIAAGSLCNPVFHSDRPGLCMCNWKLNCSLQHWFASALSHKAATCTHTHMVTAPQRRPPNWNPASFIIYWLTQLIHNHKPQPPLPSEVFWRHMARCRRFVVIQHKRRAVTLLVVIQEISGVGAASQYSDGRCLFSSINTTTCLSQEFHRHCGIILIEGIFS